MHYSKSAVYFIQINLARRLLMYTYLHSLLVFSSRETSKTYSDKSSSFTTKTHKVQMRTDVLIK